MKRFYTAMSLVAVLLYMASLSLATTSSNFTNLSALLAFKSEIKTEPNNVLGSNWTEPGSFCKWVRVSCSRRRQIVTALSLTSMGLQGTISPYVGNLSFLVTLDLSNNSFYGHLIPEIGHLRRLSIPASVYHCQTLQVISLAYNKLRGVLPKFWLSNLTSLHFLYLGMNNFTGTIPPPLVNNSKVLHLCLHLNNRHGSIPDEIGNLHNSEAIVLEVNNLNGTIPSSIFNISSLRILALDTNYLSGTLPSTFGLQLPNLGKLYLNLNQLSGSIPSYLSNCSQLTILALSSKF